MCCLVKSILDSIDEHIYECFNTILSLYNNNYVLLFANTFTLKTCFFINDTFWLFLTLNMKWVSFFLSSKQIRKISSSTEKSKWQISKWVYNAKSQVLFHWKKLKRSFNILNGTSASFLFTIQLWKTILSNPFFLSMKWVSFSLSFNQIRKTQFNWKIEMTNFKVGL